MVFVEVFTTRTRLKGTKPKYQTFFGIVIDYDYRPISERCVFVCNVAVGDVGKRLSIYCEHLFDYYYYCCYIVIVIEC